MGSIPDPAKDIWKDAPDRTLTLHELWNEHGQLDDWVAGLVRKAPDPFPESAEAVCQRWENRMVAIEDEMAERIALTKADLIAQLHLLRWHNQDFVWSEWDDALVGKLIAGIAILGADNSRLCADSKALAEE